VNKQKSFLTMTEMMLGVALIAIVAALAIPFFERAQNKGRFAGWQALKNELLNDPDLQVYYDFSDGQGVVLRNLSRSGMGASSYDPMQFDGRLMQGAEWVHGRWKMKWALKFNGVNSHVVSKADMSGAAFSVAMWFRTRKSDCGLFATTETAIPGSKEDRSIFIKQGKLYSRLPGGQVASKGNVADGKWHQLVVTAGILFKKHQIYIDGVLQESSDKLAFGSKEQKNFILGYSRDSLNPHFDGVVDELIVLSRELKADEVSQLYREGHP